LKQFINWFIAVNKIVYSKTSVYIKMLLYCIYCNEPIDKLFQSSMYNNN